MASLAEMKTAVKSLYDSSAWRYKVDLMKKEQIYAIYQKSNKAGKFNKEKKEEDYHQLTLAEVEKEYG